VLPAVLLPSRMQVRLNVIGADRFEPDPTPGYVRKEIAGLVRVVRNDGKS
jgi:hypothetical protein